MVLLLGTVPIHTQLGTLTVSHVVQVHGGMFRCDGWQKQAIVFENHSHACRKVCDGKEG